MVPLTILRTGAGSPVAPGVIAALKSAGGVRVIAADMDPRSVGFLAADASVVIPAATNPSFVEAVLEICERERVDVFFPDVDEELVPVAEAMGRFEAAGVRVFLSGAEAIRASTDKVALAERLAELGVPGPRTLDPKTLGAGDFPVFVKPRRGRGSRGARRVESADELRRHLASNDDPIVQELVRGVELTVDGLSSLEGEFLYAAVRERVATDSGISVKGRTTTSPLIEGHAKTIAEGIGLVGPSCIQCIVGDDGVPKFTDVNPRLGGGTILSEQAGAPVISDCVRLMRGEKPRGKAEFRSGVLMMRRWAEEFIDPLAAVKAVIFDLDYTLYDADGFARGALSDVAAAIAERHGRDATELESALTATRERVGADHPKLFDAWLAGVGLGGTEDVRASVDAFHGHAPPRLDPYPGVRELIAELRERGIKTGIVTDGHSKMQRAKLAAVGLESEVDTVVLCAEAGAAKPDPGGLERALKTLGVTAAEAAYVGDHPGFDLVMARRAGVVAVRVLTGAFANRADDPGGEPDVVVGNVAELRNRVGASAWTTHPPTHLPSWPAG